MISRRVTEANLVTQSLRWITEFTGNKTPPKHKEINAPRNCRVDTTKERQDAMCCHKTGCCQWRW